MTRDDVVAEALTWEGTPYHHQGGVKGAGVDCAFLLVRVFHSCGLIPNIDPRPYPPDWHLHRSEERYMKWVQNYARQTENPLPGDVVLYKFGRCVSHGAIVLEWPHVLHSYLGYGCVRADATQEPLASHYHSCWTLFK